MRSRPPRLVENLLLEPPSLVQRLRQHTRPATSARLRGVLRGGAAGAGAEHEQLGQRIRTEAVGAVDADAGDFPGRVQPRQRRRPIDVGMHAAHHVVDDRTHRNQILDRIEVLVLAAQLADERDLRVDHLLAQVPEIEVHDRAVRRLDRAALLLLLA